MEVDENEVQIQKINGARTRQRTSAAAINFLNLDFIFVYLHLLKVFLSNQNYISKLY